MIERIRKAFSGEQSIGRHPLFPAIVALWFCALFGLGGFAFGGGALPGLDAPLGFGERIVLALVMAAIGGFVGGRLARRMMRPVAHPRRRRASAADQPGRNAALLDELDQVSDIPARRRPLATPAEPEGDATHFFAEAAPLPGGAPQILDLAQVDFDALDDAAPGEAATDAADTEWSAASDAPGDDTGGARVGAEAAAFDAPAADLSEAAAEPTDAPETEPTAAPWPARAVFCAAEGNSAERIAGALLDDLSSVELVERLGLSLQRRRAARAAAPVDAGPVDAGPVDAGSVEVELDDAARAHELAPLPAATQHDEAASGDDGGAEPAFTPDQPFEAAPLRGPRADLGASWIDAPDAGDSMVAAWPTERRLPRAFLPLPLADAGDAEADEDSESTAIAPPRRFDMAAQARDDVDHDEGPIVTRHRRFGRRDEPQIVVDAPDDRAGKDEKRFSSLLDASVPRPVRRPFIRIEDLDDVDGDADESAESMVVFPWREAGRSAARAETPGEPGFDRIAGVISSIAAPAPQLGQEADIAAAPMAADEARGRGADMEETERALYSALASLKRISGAA